VRGDRAGGDIVLKPADKVFCPPIGRCSPLDAECVTADRSGLVAVHDMRTWRTLYEFNVGDKVGGAQWVHPTHGYAMACRPS